MKRINLHILWALCGLPALAHGAEFTVDTTADAVDALPGDGLCATDGQQCSLRAAIQETNALAGADLITLPAGVYNLTLHGAAEDFAASGDLDIRGDLTIQGAGADQTFVDGMAQDRVFHVTFDRNTRIAADATINAITIRNGNANTSIGSDNMGGGIRSEGRLRLNDCNVDRNFSYAGGGGVFASFWGYPNEGYLEINRCNITNNTDSGFGGGVSANDVYMLIRDSLIATNKATAISGSVFGGGLYYGDSTYPSNYDSQVINTTIMDNSALTQGGGVLVLLGNLTLTNSTVSGNLAYNQGGGLFSSSGTKVTLDHVTLSNNQAPTGGGLMTTDTTALVTIEDSIIAANPLGGNCAGNGSITKLGNNLDSDESCGFTLSGVNPLLVPLADNGGPSPTHALGATSPAIGNALGCPATDQRSYPRPAQNCDLGAVEMEAVASGPEVQTPPLNSGTSTDGDNLAPTAWSLPYAITAGGVLEGIMNGYDPDGDPIIYEFPLSGPDKGSVAVPVPGSANSIPEGFTYTPRADASGYDSFTYRICDNRGACSDPATISIYVSSGAAVDSAIAVELNATAGNTNDLVVVSESELQAVAPDVDYSYPIGAYFFEVTNIPTDQNGQAQETSVIIQLPAEADVSNAVVRKIDNTGIWQTLGSTPDPTVSSAVIDAINNTITLTLRDNDIFDSDPQVGVINDPVAVGFAPGQVPNPPATPPSGVEPPAEPVPDPVTPPPVKPGHGHGENNDDDEQNPDDAQDPNTTTTPSNDEPANDSVMQTGVENYPDVHGPDKQSKIGLGSFNPLYWLGLALLVMMQPKRRGR